MISRCRYLILYMTYTSPTRELLIFFRWMLYAAVLFTIFHGFMWNIPIFWTSKLTKDGVCYTYAVWSSPTSMQAYAVLCGVWLLYPSTGRNVLLLRQNHTEAESRTAPEVKVNPTTNNEETTTKQNPKPTNQEEGNTDHQTRRANQDEGNSKQQCKPANKEEGISKHQINVIKTMIIISVTFAVTTFFDNYGFIDWAFVPADMINKLQYVIYVTLFYLNVWVDPFIYVLGNKEIRKSFLSHLACLRANG